MPATRKVEQEVQSPTPALPKKRTTAAPKPKLLPPHAVILHNDAVNGFDFAVEVLRKVFHYGGAKAFWLTLRAHVGGRSVIWSGSKEVAELKADQVRGCGPDPRKASAGARPLRTSIEPMPG